MMQSSETDLVLSCRICGNGTGNTLHVAREMMFGARDRFEYIECAACGCVQIRDIPDDLSKYYPEDYYAFKSPKPAGRIKSYFRHIWADHNLGHPSLIGAALTRVYGRVPFLDWVSQAGATYSSAILDVGSGQGKLLNEMASCGFTHLIGADPYISSDLHYGSGVVVLKRDVAELSGAYDLVMSHHSFEHVPDPERVLAHLQRLTRPDGVVLIRIPVASSWAWSHYGTDWVGMDPPRHLFLHTPASIDLLAQKAGLRVENVVYDSGAMQFWASEQYRMDIPYMDDRSYYVNPDKSPFSAADIRAFEQQARQLNAEGQGDTAAFYLRRAS